MRAMLVSMVAAGALAAPALAQDTVGTVPIVRDGAVLDISAEGRTTRVPDVATIRAGVVTQGATAAAALTGRHRSRR